MRIFLAAAALFGAAMTAHADSSFFLTDSRNTFSFDIPDGSQFFKGQTSPQDDYYYFSPITAAVNGSTDLYSVTFFDQYDSGGFEIDDALGNFIILVGGSQLYSVENGVPVFNAGDYSVETIGRQQYQGFYSLEINNTAATPEPSSLALLGTGILGVIGAARRRFA